MEPHMDTKQYPVTRTEAEWRKLLTPEQYEIMREHGTEAPDSCALNIEKRSCKFVWTPCELEIGETAALFPIWRCSTVRCCGRVSK